MSSPWEATTSGGGSDGGGGRGFVPTCIDCAAGWGGVTSLAFDSEPLDSEPPDLNSLEDWGWEDSNVMEGTTCPSRPSTGTSPTTRGTMVEDHGGGRAEDRGGGMAEDQTLTSDWREQEKLREQELLEHWSLIGRSPWVRRRVVNTENGFNGWRQ